VQPSWSGSAGLWEFAVGALGRKLVQIVRLESSDKPVLEARHPDFTDQPVIRLTTDRAAPTTSSARKRIRAGQRRPGGTAMNGSWIVGAEPARRNMAVMPAYRRE
jgi:hypothetical protein